MILADRIEIDHRDKCMSETKNKSENTSNDFVVGLITFVVFIVFMTIWMYFGSVD